MLQIKHIRKEYRTGKLVQKALDDVSLNLRDNEFVAILGPSGSGKTTLLNIIGGLDRYDSGDLIINGISTKKYKDRDWDSYRNHTIGFVFQSYNLIPHQTVLSNVELALTISGIGKSERRARAKRALEQVGLGDQLHKKPNQMSGGQMQRVAIARALVNDPDILLADEPTGALDSDTSVQVMDLLREVARDRLVVMVTHNPELAEAYATRIVNLRDGKIRSDSAPYEVNEHALEPPKHKNMGKSSMSFLTALALSFNNLRTKKARTLLTSFAGSIGIIGIAAILALSTGVNAYIRSIEEETLSEYPLQIQSTGFDFTSLMSTAVSGGSGEAADGEIEVLDMMTSMFSRLDSNDLASLKTYLDSGQSGMEPYINAIEYTYSATPQIYLQNGEDVRQVNPDSSFSALGIGSGSSSSSLVSSVISTDMFYQMPETASLYESQYDVMAGRWPEAYNECVVVLTSGGGLSDFMLYTLGLRDAMELDEMIQQFIDEEPIQTPEDMGTYTYDDLLGITFKLVSSADYYEYDSDYGIWRDKTDDEEYMRDLVAAGEDLTVVGVVQPSEDGNGFVLSSGIGYTADLSRHVAEVAEQSEIVQDQLANPDINVFTGEPFGEESDQSDFDMESLFTVDSDAMESAFQFDEDALNESIAGSFDLSDTFSDAGNSIDLGGALDLGDITVELPDMPAFDLAELMDGVEVTVSYEQLGALATQLVEGYQAYAAEHPEADYSNLANDFLAYLRTDQAGEVLAGHIQSIIEANGGPTVTTQDLQDLVVQVMAGYQAYAAEQGYTDPEQFDTYLLEYLQTDGAQRILTAWADEHLQLDAVEIAPEQLGALAEDLAAGYQAYAVENGLPDPSRMGEHFANYLSQSEVQEQIMTGLAGMVDLEDIQSQISGMLEGYFREVFGAYGEAISGALEEQITSAMGQVMDQLASGMESAMKDAFQSLGESLEDAFQIDADAFAGAIEINMDGEDLIELMMSLNSAASATYDGNLSTLGCVDFDSPTEIDIYPIDFESKEYVVDILDAYNERMEAEGKEEQVISYTDMVGSLMSSVTEIIDTISYVLIAFVAISLVVSSIMIGVITYISVLERKKEIGILRAIGASKGNISQVFNAETFIIGLCSGLIGIGLTLLLLIPGNALIHHLAGTTDVNAVLPLEPALILIALSVVLTLIGGLIPSRKAAKSDPVAALRTE